LAGDGETFPTRPVDDTPPPSHETKNPLCQAVQPSFARRSPKGRRHHPLATGGSAARASRQVFICPNDSPNKSMTSPPTPNVPRGHRGTAPRWEQTSNSCPRRSVGFPPFVPRVSSLSTPSLLPSHSNAPTQLRTMVTLSGSPSHLIYPPRDPDSTVVVDLSIGPTNSSCPPLPTKFQLRPRTTGLSMTSKGVAEDYLEVDEVDEGG